MNYMMSYYPEVKNKHHLHLSTYYLVVCNEIKIICFLCVFINGAFAKDCFDMAGQYYNIDPDLLRAIAQQESGFNQGAIRKNINGSIDIGVMQINSQHARFLYSRGVTLQMLKDNECVNIYTGAYILHQNFKKWGKTWNAVGAYNVGFRKKDARNRYKYSSKIYYYYVNIKRLKN
ncbi:X polypeptide [Escherichia coli M605]|uniref:X polypeptide n=2 Tax=Escherichia coli TaxID=562 RepID=F4SY65_ECOLX|nr:X polypeptide [Escherichia coli M605]